MKEVVSIKAQPLFLPGTVKEWKSALAIARV